MIALHDPRALCHKRLHLVATPFRVRPVAHHIAQNHRLPGAAQFDIGQNGGQCLAIGMYVGDDRNACHARALHILGPHPKPWDGLRQSAPAGWAVARPATLRHCLRKQAFSQETA